MVATSLPVDTSADVFSPVIKDCSPINPPVGISTWSPFFNFNNWSKSLSFIARPKIILILFFFAFVIREFIDNFEGPGKSIDYEEDEFENWEHIDTFDCDYDAKQDPSTISFYFGDKIVTFDISVNSYDNKNITYTKENIIELLKSK